MVMQQVGNDRENFKIFGYSRQMPELMKISDLFIGKPGGLTTAEALACGLPMVIVSPIPGQEERNSDHLLEDGVAVKCNEMTTIPYKIDKLLQNPVRLESMRRNAFALGRPNGLRNADNDLKLSEVGTEVHSLSQVFTGGVYDVLADIFAHEQRPNLRDDAAVLYDVGQYMAGVVVRAIIAAPAAAATFADVVNRMRQIVVADGKPQYRPFITNQFALREVVPPGSLDVDGDLEAHIVDEPDAVQDRRRCCGTMRMEQDGEDERALAEWVDELAVAFAGDDPAAANGAADKDSTRRHPAKSARK